MEWQGFVGWAFQGLLTIILGLFWWVFRDNFSRATGALESMSKRVNDMADSIEKLNTHVAVLIERDENKEKRIDDHELRIRGLEKVRPGEDN